MLRRLATSTVLALFAASVLACSGSDAPSSSASPETPPTTTHASTPNVLLIIADDLGIDSTLVYADADGDGDPDDGRTYAPSPNISRLCREGVLFRNAWSAPTCSPTRATILTGRHGFRTGIGTALLRSGGIDPGEPTVPRMLDAQPSLGFRHANIGKWHLGTTPALGGDSAPNTMGWSHYAGSLDGELPDYSDWQKTEDGVTAEVTRYAATENVDDAIRWIGDGDPASPWLLWLAFNLPHAPFHLPPAELHSATGLSGDPTDIEQNPAPYYQAMIEAMDTEIGRLLTWLDENGQGNTNILFLGDNGTTAKVVLDPYDPRRGKDTLYQGGVNIPLCVSGPAVAKGGRESSGLVHTVDLFATMLDLAGVDREATLPKDVLFDSVSLMPYLDNTASGSVRSWVMTEQFGGMRDSGKTVRDERYKLIRFDDGREELYDLQEDPMELKELLSATPQAPETAARRTSLAKTLDDLLATEPAGG